MIAEWPRKSPYAEAAARLRDAILVASLRDAINQSSAQMSTAARDHVSNNHATNIRDTIDTLTSERKRP
jgi:hypothetical protein|nr:MAG TPA: Protein of unknown function (DUF2746) [Caudoviricetes sp.]